MSDPHALADAVKLFYSYAHEDEPLRDELADHLKILERRGLIRPWHDRKIVSGSDWAATIDDYLDSAELVLLLISKDFLASDYIFGVELERAMQRQAEQGCDVVPVFLRAVDIEPEDAEDLPFMKLQGLPTDLKAVTSWPNRDEAWTDVAKGLRKAVNRIRERKAADAATGANEGGPGNGFASPHPSPRPAPVAAGTDPTLERIVDGVIGQVGEAQRERAGPPVTGTVRADLDQETRRLIDVPDQKRILWVDDHPDNNRRERAALARLQIDVQIARSTREALGRIDEGLRSGEPYDLVLTDWSRPRDGPEAGLGLIDALRTAGHVMPVVVYHGEFDAGRRVRRAAQVASAGGLGEAVLPAELMQLVSLSLTPRDA